LGQQETTPKLDAPEYDETCLLCPGNVRVSGQINQSYPSTFVFENDFPAVYLQHGPENRPINTSSDLIRTESVQGICRVMCFSPRHNATLSDLSNQEVRSVIDAWSSQFVELSSIESINHIMIFENKGEMMGCSNPHPHCQIWATGHIPEAPLKAYSNQKKYFERFGRALLSDYVNWELSQNSRIVKENSGWIAVVPFWASWPFEVMIIPKRAVSLISELTENEKNQWAQIIGDLSRIYDKLFSVSFPYSMGLYQPPCKLIRESHGFVLHQIFMPPLLRSATVKKFMVGYELCAEPQRDISPELAADRLRTV
jgi:UDPglucose--hexose-1-phosphate uridylyltransferase